jgi:hypothetical protein
MMEEIEKIDKSQSMWKAKAGWKKLLKMQEFQAINLSMMKEKAREIRARYLGEEEVMIGW